MTKLCVYVAEQERGNNWGNGNNGKFDKTKKKRKWDFNKVSEDGYKG